MLARNSESTAELAASVAALGTSEEDNFLVQPECQVTRFFSTGSTLLNLAMTDKPFHGWPCGRMSNIIGDSSAGKSFLVLTGLAEAAHNPEFDDYLLVYDDVEFANTFNIRALFGQKTADRLQAPRYVDGQPRNSRTVEDWYANVMRLLDAGQPFIYVCDSVDALTSASSIARSMEYVKEQDKNDASDESGVAIAPEVKGSYKTDKPKLLSEALANIVSGLAATNSCLLMISQTRDNLNAMGYGNTKTRSGGKALKFYATHEMWMAHLASIAKTVRGVNRKIGDTTRLKLSKNKVTGKQREVEFSLYYSYGVDDIGSCLSFLETAGVITKASRSIILKNEQFGLDLSGTADNVARKISESADLLQRLRMLTGDTWNHIEEDICMDRCARYE